MESRVAIVTGAAQSIGLACAAILLREGASVLLADVDASRGEEAAADLAKSYPAKVKFIKTDVTKDDDLQRMVQLAVDTWGGVDALIASAAIFVLKGVSVSREDFAKSLDVNVISVSRTVHYFVEAYKKTRGEIDNAKPKGKGGAIVLFGSISGTIAQPDFVS